MKKQNKLWLFLSGMLSGVVLALCIGAAGEQKQDVSRVQVTALINGTTAFWDPASGRLYVYDANLSYCTTIREITTLGEPMRRIRDTR